MTDFHKMAETPLDRAIDSAMEKANGDALESPEALNALEYGHKWRIQMERLGILPKLEGSFEMQIWGIDREGAIVQAMEILGEESSVAALDLWKVERVPGRLLRGQDRKRYRLYKIEIPIPVTPAE